MGLQSFPRFTSFDTPSVIAEVLPAKRATDKA
jgi:hypothetical protein